MDEPSGRLVALLVEAYGPYLRRRLEELGVEAPSGFDAVVASGRDRLADALTDLLALPYRDQRRGPLEVFQEAMREPTEALARAGVDPVIRDEVAVAALPGDLFELAPASSRALGETVWHAHLAWGLAKAQALRREGERP